MLDLWDEVRRSYVSPDDRATKKYRLPQDILDGLRIQKTGGGQVAIPLSIAQCIKRKINSDWEIDDDELSGYSVEQRFNVFGGYSFFIVSSLPSGAETFLEVTGAGNPSIPRRDEFEHAPVAVVAMIFKTLRDCIAEGRPRAGPAAAGASGGRRTRRKSKKTARRR